MQRLPQKQLEISFSHITPRDVFNVGECMRTDDEILARIEEVKADDWIGWQTSNLIVRLPFEKAKPYLKPEAKAEEWKISPRDHDALLAEMLDYMPFAWEKANNELFLISTLRWANLRQ